MNEVLQGFESQRRARLGTEDRVVAEAREQNSDLVAAPAPQLDLRSTPVNYGQIRRAVELALRLGDPDAARRAAIALSQHMPAAIAPIVLLGQALLDAGTSRAAIEQFRCALKLNPLDAVAWAGLAGALARYGQRVEAQAALRRAALHDPLGSEALAPGIVQLPTSLGLGIVYLRRGHAALACPELAAMIERHPWRDDLRVYYIEALRRAGDLPAARQEFGRFANEDVVSLPLLLLRAALAVDPTQSAAAREQCTQFDPDGQIARRFFAPELPPWPLPPAPIVPWDGELAAIERYVLHALAAPKAIVGAEEFGAPVGRPAAPAVDKRLVQGRDHVSGFEISGAIATQQASADPPKAPDDERLAAQPDPDVSAVVATAERLRHRLADVVGAPSALVPRNISREYTQILLTSKSALSRRYGEAGFAAVDRRLRALVWALRQRGIQAHCCYSDDAASLNIDDRIALAPVAQEAPALRDLVRAMADGLAQQRRRLGTLLLIGGDDIVPFHRLPNPLPDGDEAVLSDNPYGTDDAGYLLPQWTVARLPEGASDDPTLLLSLLDQMVEYHQRGDQHAGGRRVMSLIGLRWGAARPRSLAARGYSADIWRETSRAVLDAFIPDAPLICSPPLDADNYMSEGIAAGELLYLNLHGVAGLPNWYGQAEAYRDDASERLPIALRPSYFLDEPIVGGLLVSEACYGLDIAGRTQQTSIPLCALAEGALACVGAMVNAYGSTTTPLLGADLLCQRLLAQLQRGVSVGEALREARMEFAQTMYRRQGYLDDVDIKTLTEFVLLGDPWASTATAAAAPMAWPVSKLTSIERVPKPRPKALLLEDQVARDIVQRAREALKRILPSATAAPLRITAQPNPRQFRKGDADQELIFSAQASRPTADGHAIAQTAHVTLNGRMVVKVALTR